MPNYYIALLDLLFHRQVSFQICCASRIFQYAGEGQAKVSQGKVKPIWERGTVFKHLVEN